MTAMITPKHSAQLTNNATLLEGGLKHPLSINVSNGKQPTVLIKPKIKTKLKPVATPKPTISATPKRTISATPKRTISATPKRTISATPKPRTVTQKVPEVPNPKTQIKATPKNIVIAPKPIVIESEGESDDDDMSIVSNDEGSDVYHRWIGGKLLLISADNKYIFHPTTLEHIGTVIDETDIEWI